MDAGTAKNAAAHVVGISRAGSDCSEARHKIGAASVSSVCCASNGNLSLSRSSSDSQSLNCAELNVEDMKSDSDSGKMEKTAELPRSHGDASRMACTPTTQYYAAGDIYQALRDDLQKQEDALLQCTTTSDASCSYPHNYFARAVPCRLPATHRTLLVGWMREVTGALRLHLTTLFTATHLLDRFVAATQMLPPDNMLQLLALTCMSVAVKYNEVPRFAPQVWLSLAVDSFGRRLYRPTDLQRFEWSVLQTIGWRLHQPTTLTFLQHYMACLAAKAGDDPSGRLGPATAPCFPQEPQGAPWASGRFIAVASPVSTSGYQQAMRLQHVWPAPRAADDVAAAVGLNASLIRWPVIKGAMALAERSLSYDALLPYSFSTVALACLILSACFPAPHAVATTPAMAINIAGTGSIALWPAMVPVSGLPKLAGSPLAVSISAAVSGCCGVHLDQLAPGLVPCLMALEKCHQAALLGQAP